MTITKLFEYLDHPCRPNYDGIYEYMRRINNKLIILTIIPGKPIHSQYHYIINAHDVSSKDPMSILQKTVHDINEYFILVKTNFEREYKHAA